MSRADSRTRGFTLVELLVALAIFALLSGFAYRALGAMLDARERLRDDARKWRDVAVFVSRLERDLGSIVPRLARGPSGTLLSPVSSSLATQDEGEGLAITRSGSPLMENALAAPQRVAYRLREGRVERLSWAALDAAPREEPSAVPILGRAIGSSAISTGWSPLRWSVRCSSGRSTKGMSPSARWCSPGAPR